MLSAFNIAFCSFLYFTEKLGWQRLLAHAVSALLIDVRLIGITVPAMTSVALVVKATIKDKHRVKQLCISCSISLLTWLFVIAGWPVLWEGPFTHFVRAFNEMRNFPWSGRVWFMGHFFKGSSAVVLPTPVDRCFSYSILHSL